MENGPTEMLSFTLFMVCAKDTHFVEWVLKTGDHPCQTMTTWLFPRARIAPYLQVSPTTRKETNKKKILQLAQITDSRGIASGIPPSEIYFKTPLISGPPVHFQDFLAQGPPVIFRQPLHCWRPTTVRKSLVSLNSEIIQLQPMSTSFTFKSK